MNIETTGLYRSNWFERKGPYAVLKPEYKADLAAAIAEKKQQDTEALRLFMEEIKENGTAVELTDEQKAELSAKYDPEHMTQEDYREFVDQLCEYGVLKQEDKPHVAYGGLTELDFAQPIAQVSAIPTQGLSSAFSSCNGNALDWARFRATFEAFDPVTQSFEKTRSALLFEKIESVLEQMVAEKPDEKAVHTGEQVDALLDSAGYARMADMDNAALYNKLSDASRNVLSRIEIGRDDITKEEWTALCKELLDLGAITETAFGAVRRDFTLIPLGPGFEDGGRFSYGAPPGMADKLRSLHNSGLAGARFGLVTDDGWTGDPIAYFDAWFKSMQKWRDDLASEQSGTAQPGDFAPLDNYLGAWGEVSALLNDLMKR